MSLTGEDLIQVRDVPSMPLHLLSKPPVMPRFDEHDKCLDVIDKDIHEIKEGVNTSLSC